MRKLEWLSLIILLLTLSILSIVVVSVDNTLEECQQENRRLLEELRRGTEHSPYAQDPPIHLITAYSNDCGRGRSINVEKWCDGLTATLTPARRGVCAADWRVFPPGTRLYIKGYGECTVEDTGSAMHHSWEQGIIHIDVFMDTREEALEWGRRRI